MPLGHYGGPKVGAVSYERDTPVVVSYTGLCPQKNGGARACACTWVQGYLAHMKTPPPPRTTVGP